MAEGFTRREVLLLGVAGSLAACTTSTSSSPSTTTDLAAAALPGSSVVGVGTRKGPHASDLPRYEPSASFPEGIMSGDPSPDGVVLWTRPSADLVASGKELIAELAGDLSFATIAKTVSSAPDAARQGSTKFIIDGLQPGSTYFYRFRIGDAVSPVGLTRTAPAPGAAVESLTMAVFSCQRWTHGYFTAHADLAEQAPDIVVCLGDYVYNTGAADGITVPGRDDPIQDAHTLDEFRGKYEHYRSDVNLQAMHSRSPLIAIPDNHDGATRPDDDMYPGAHQAFFEKMPVREDPTNPFRTHRRITWGGLLDLWMLDLRQFHTPGDRGSGNTDGDTKMMDPEVTYLGDEQRSWLFGGLADTKATWQILGSSKQFSPLRISADGTPGVRNGGSYINMDQWDGYQAERMRVLDEVERLGRTAVVAVSGDMHWFWASEVPKDFDDPASVPIMTDFLCGGISSSNADERIGGGTAGPQSKTLIDTFGPANANYVRYFEADRHGYGLFSFHGDRAEVEYRSPRTIREPVSTAEVVARFRLDPTRAGLELVEAVGWDAETGLPDGWDPATRLPRPAS